MNNSRLEIKIEFYIFCIYFIQYINYIFNLKSHFLY